MKKKTVLQGLKEYMLLKNLSVVDLNWNTLKKYNISMPKLLRWEMKGMKCLK